MSIRAIAGTLSRLTAATILSTAVGVALAQGPPRGQQHGRPDQGSNFHFRDQDRSRFQSHYGRDVQRWQRNPRNRPRFYRGQRIPSNYHFRPVPRSYYAGMPPPPPGYQYGYYDGYVVAYNPTTRIIADVMDLVTAAVTSR